jgi:hypothetical protein
MSISKWAWKPRDVERALAVAERSGLRVTGYTISKTGDITVMTGASAPTSEPSPLETWKAKKQHARAAEGDQQ